MQNMYVPNWKEVALIVLVAGAAFGAHQYFQAEKKADIARYYSIIENQEKLRDDVSVTEQDIEGIERCQKGSRKVDVEDCTRDFYATYTMEHGGEKAFAHLARLQKERPDLLPSCHYISHGIGNAMYRLSGDDLYKAYVFMSGGKYFKNVATCGNGYFHGVIEEASKGVVDRDDLLALLQPVCENEQVVNAGGCYHGVGHAATIQTDYSIEDMLYICDRMSTKPERVFECHTGGFMEYAQNFPDAVEVEDGHMRFVLCDSLDQRYQPACYMEQSSFFERYSRERRDYVRNIGFCKQISDSLNRMACVKLFAIRAVRIVHFNEIEDMCRNTSSPQERVMCTAVVAGKIAGSVDATRKTAEYRDIATSVCGTLAFFEKRSCENLVFSARSHLFYTSEADLTFSTTIGLPKGLSLLSLI